LRDEDLKQLALDAAEARRLDKLQCGARARVPARARTRTACG
jgi:hypothetical protein